MCWVGVRSAKKHAAYPLWGCDVTVCYLYNNGSDAGLCAIKRCELHTHVCCFETPGGVDAAVCREHVAWASCSMGLM